MSRFRTRTLELLGALKSGEPTLDRSIPAEDLWPASLEKEADKAASILRSFFLDGFIVPYRTLGVLPHEAFKDCRGLAVFHVMREGLRSPLASGSGVVISRLEGAKWSGASATLVDYDLSDGIDVADVVILINDERSMNALYDAEVSIAKALSIEPGQIPHSEAVATRLNAASRRAAAAFSYAKSKDELAEIDLKELVIREASDRNEQFYGVPGVWGREVLSGYISTPAGASDHLYSTLSTLDKQSSSLSGLPKAGKCPGNRRVRVPTNSSVVEH